MRKGIISYDITNTKERTRLYKILCGYGKRVQFSVFEFELENDIFDEMFKKIVTLYTDNKINSIMVKNKKAVRFSIRIYEICNSCWKKGYLFEEKEKLHREDLIF